MMEQGKIKAQGSFTELEKRKDFSDLMKLNDINKDQIKQDNEKEKSLTLSKKYSLNLEIKKSKSVFESKQESFAVNNNNEIQDPVTIQVQDEDDSVCLENL